MKSLYLNKHEDFVVIDVREPEEFQDWKIQGSINVPLGYEFTSKVKEIAADSQVITVCRTGVRSLYAVGELNATGLYAKSLSGGLVAWSNTYVTSGMEIPGSPSSKLIQIRRLSKGCASYIVACEDECAVVDPSSRVEEYVRLAKSKGFTITHVIDTHKHADHVSGARLLASRTGAELLLPPLDRYAFDGYTPLLDGGDVGLGDGKVRVVAIHTPGHTLGSTSLLVSGSLLLSGDTLFLDGMGRPDLQGSTAESAKQLYLTCQNIFDKLESSTAVFPGHFGSRTDLIRNDLVSAPISSVEANVKQVDLSDSDSVKTLVQNLPKPANFEAILRINSGEDDYDVSVIDLLEEGHNRCALPLGGG